MILPKIYPGILTVLLIPSLSAQPHLLPKPGFEERIHHAVNTMRIVDPHEHIMSEKEALAAPADFSCLFTNYQMEDLISSGVATDQIYNTFKRKDATIGEKWAVIKNNWPNTRNTGYGRSVLIAAKELYGIDDLNESTYRELSRHIADLHKPGYCEEILKKRAGIDACLIMEYNTTNRRDLVHEVYGSDDLPT